MKIDKEVNFIIEKLNENNFEAFMVGGCVRDIILKKTPKDFDITTSAKPQEIKSIFGKTIDTGIQHGTVTVVLNKKNYEVTTYRIDGEYKDNRRPENVIYTNSLKEDLARRDFTMNAIAYHPNSGFIDYFSGREDIERKLIRAVGDPNQRFNEDALRMIRAIRFSSQLGFEIESATIDAIKNNSDLIQYLSIERIRDEFVKMLLSDYFENFELFAALNLAEYIDENLNIYIQKNSANIIKYIPFAKKDIIVRLAVFFYKYDIDEIENILKFLRFDNKTIKQLKIILKSFSVYVDANFYSVRKEIYKIGYENFEKLLEMHKSIANAENIRVFNVYINKLERIYKKTKNKNYVLSLKALDINGQDLSAMAKGELIGDALNYLMMMVIKYPIFNKKQILMRLAAHYIKRN